MDIKKKTALFVVGTMFLMSVIWVGYDVYAIIEGGTEASISYMFYSWSYKYPIFTWSMGFLPGVLVGHFFWRIRDTKETQKFSDMSRE